MKQEEQKIWDYVNEKFAKVSNLEDMERVLNKPSMKAMWSEENQKLIMEYWKLIQYGELEEIEEEEIEEAILDHEGYIWIRQFCEESETVDLVRVTLQQFSALVKALGLPEGTYMMEYKNEL